MSTTYPRADVATGSWTKQNGGTTDLYATVDEITADDTDYVTSEYAATWGTLDVQRPTWADWNGQTWTAIKSTTP